MYLNSAKQGSFESRRQFNQQVLTWAGACENDVSVPNATSTKQLHDIFHSFISSDQSSAEQRRLNILFVVEIAPLLVEATSEKFARSAVRLRYRTERRIKIEHRAHNAVEGRMVFIKCLK